MRKTVNNKYDPNELSEFEDLIQNKLRAAQNELIYMKKILDKTDVDEVKASVKLFEESSEECEKENLSRLATRQNQFISKLEQALVRIKNGTYGICMISGERIGKARLKAVPHTTLSMAAKMGRNKNR